MQEKNIVIERLFPIKKLETIPSRELAAELAAELIKYKKSKIKVQQEFIKEIIANKKDINNEAFLDYFKYQNPLFLVKDLISAKQIKIRK